MAIMNFQQALIAALCSIAVIGNPVLAGLKPCCCTRPAEKQASCFHDRQSQATEPSKKSCCAKKEPVRTRLVRPCECCFTNAPQPLTSNSVPLLKPSAPVDLFTGDLPQASLTTATASLDNPNLGAGEFYGPSLLALLCRWLN